MAKKNSESTTSRNRLVDLGIFPDPDRDERSTERHRPRGVQGEFAERYNAMFTRPVGTGKSYKESTEELKAHLACQERNRRLLREVILWPERDEASLEEARRRLEEIRRELRESELSLGLGAIGVCLPSRRTLLRHRESLRERRQDRSVFATIRRITVTR